MSLLEELEAAGIPEEYRSPCKKIIENGFIPKSRFSELIAERHSLQEELTALKSEVQAKDDLITRVSGDNKELKAKFKAQAMTVTIEGAIRDMGIQNPKRIMKLLDTQSMKTGENGEIVGLTEQMETLRTDYPELFPAQPTTSAQGQAPPPTSPTQGNEAPRFAGYKPIPQSSSPPSGVENAPTADMNFKDATEAFARTLYAPFLQQ